MRALLGLMALIPSLLSARTPPTLVRRSVQRHRIWSLPRVELLEARDLLTTIFDPGGNNNSPHILQQFDNLPGPEVISDEAPEPFLRLVQRPAQFPNYNALSFALTDPGPWDQITADFDFRIQPDPPGSLAADGFGFLFLNTAQFSTSGAVRGDADEANQPRSVGIGIDPFPNPGELGVPHLSVHFSGFKLAEFPIPPTLRLVGDTFLHAHILLRPAAPYSDVTVALTAPGGPTITLVDRFVIPTLIPYETRIQVESRVGGESANHDLKNLVVQYSSLPNLRSGALDFDSLSIQADERQSEVVLPVIRTGGSEGPVTVQYTTQALTATSNSDFIPTTGTLTFAPGDVARKLIRVPIGRDVEVESQELFQVVLSNPTGGAVLGIASTALVTLSDDEGTIQNFDFLNSGTPYSVLQLEPSMPPPILMEGGPGGAGQFLRVVTASLEAGKSSSNTITFPQTDFGSFGLTITDFAFRLTPGHGRADGFGFTLLNADHYSTSTVKPELAPAVADEPNYKESLGFGFDIYRSDDLFDIGNDNVRGNYSNSLSIHYGALLPNAQFDVSHIVDLANGQWIRARIIVRAAETIPTVSVLLTPYGEQSYIVVDQFKIPALKPYPMRVHVAGRNGGESADFDFDDLSVHALDPVQSVFSFSAPSYSAHESGLSTPITVTRTGDLQTSATVDYHTVGISATPGPDFHSAAGTLTFAVGESSKSFQVPLVDEQFTEGDETFRVLLTNPTGLAVLGGASQATVTIVDDERSRTTGHWDVPVSLPIVAVHASLLHTGEILIWDRLGNVNLWNPNTGELSQAPLPGYNAFCAAAVPLADGRLLVVGGHGDEHGGVTGDGVGLRHVSIYDPVLNEWSAVTDMPAGRWYPTVRVLSTGDVLLISGDAVNKVNPLPQILQRTRLTEAYPYRDLTVAEQQQLTLPAPKPLGTSLYPWMFLAPDGKRVFKAGADRSTWWLDLEGDGNWTRGPDSIFDRSRTYGVVVMYQPGKILKVGGGEPPTSSAEIIDLNSPDPVWQSVAPMSFARRQHNGVVGPDGKVYIFGGSSSNSFGAGVNRDSEPVLPVEVWSPETNTWETLDAMTIPRFYHSVSLLLPDGRFVNGGGGEGAGAVMQQSNAEFFSPPMLFQGPRPTITSAPTHVAYGESFQVSTPDAAKIARVSLIALPSPTHSYDQNQHYVPLAFTRTANGLQVAAPASGIVAPPGGYMLFLVSEQGAPSVASIVQVAAQTLHLETEAVSLPEDATEVRIRVARTGSTRGSVSVTYGTRDGSALAGTDYAARTGTLTWPEGDSTPRTIVVPLLDDTQVEARKTFQVSLSNAIGEADLGFERLTTVTVEDNDDLFSPSQLRFSLDAFPVSEHVGTAALTVRRTGSLAGATSVDYTTQDGSAVAGEDYTPRTGTLTLAPGVRSGIIQIPILVDARSEGPETIFVLLTNPSGGATILSPSVAALTLNDPLPVDSYPANLGELATELTHHRESYGQVVTEAYRLYLKRLPDAAGLNFWVDLLQNRGLTEERLEAAFLGSTEYIANHGGTREAWVIGMYQDLLGRAPDDPGLAFWTKRLSEGADPVAISFGFAASRERETQRITANYQIYLGRDPDALGLEFWIQAFLAGVRNEDVISGFLGSREFYQDFSKGQSNRQQWVLSAIDHLFHRRATEQEVAIRLSRMRD